MTQKPPPQKGPLYDALVKNAIEREDVIQAAMARAATFDGRARVLARNVHTSAAMRDYVLRQGLAASVAGLGRAVALVQQELSTEAAAMKLQDPRTVPALRSVDIAEARSAAVQQAAPGAEQTEEEP